MFNELVESSACGRPTGKRWTIVVSAIVQSACLIIFILIPLIYTQALPSKLLHVILMEPAPAPARPTASAPVPASGKRSIRLLSKRGFYEPKAIPPKVAVYVEPELPPDTSSDLGPAGGTDVLNFLDGLRSTPAIDRPKPTPPVATKPIQQGGDVEAARLISQTQPVYPILARQARIQGTVLLHAIIDREGRVTELEVLSGHPLLVRAALEAVKLWHYQPTLLNNEPVEVDTTIRVNFVLNR